MLITCHEEFITLLGRGGTRNKLPQLELIQLPPNCAFDKALSQSALDPSTRWNGSRGYSLPSTREQSMKPVIQISKYYSLNRSMDPATKP